MLDGRVDHPMGPPRVAGALLITGGMRMQHERFDALSEPVPTSAAVLRLAGVRASS